MFLRHVDVKCKLPIDFINIPFTDITVFRIKKRNKKKFGKMNKRFYTGKIKTGGYRIWTQDSTESTSNGSTANFISIAPRRSRDYHLLQWNDFIHDSTEQMRRWRLLFDPFFAAKRDRFISFIVLNLWCWQIGLFFFDCEPVINRNNDFIFEILLLLLYASGFILSLYFLFI